VADSSIFWLRVAAGFYAVGLLHSMLVLVRGSSVLYPLARGAFRIGATLQAVAIVELGMAAGRIPVDNSFQTLNLCAFLIAVLFLAVEWKYNFASTAVAHFPLVFVMTLAAATEPHANATLMDVRGRQTLLAVHIVLVLAGYASLLLTAAASICYLVQERRLKNKKPGRLMERLPPLATLDGLIGGSLGVAFVLITLGLALVILWEFMYSGTAWIGDPRVTVSLVTWGLLLVTMYLHATAGWRGRKAAVMALVVLGCSIITWSAHAGLVTR
jgi:ABC-type transport system involved in cytochrome c biogenesis permease subunit